MDPNAPQPAAIPQPPAPVLPPPQQPQVSQTPQQQPTQAPAPPSAAQANLAHSALLGHGFKSLLSSMGGTTTTYQQGPNGPVPVETKNSAGDFFRNILASTILGGMSGASAHASGVGAGAGLRAGISAGYEANQQAQQAAQQKGQAQAQQTWQNKLSAQKAAQEATAADTENQVRKAQIAQANAETLRTNMLTQGTDYDLHQKIADADKARVSTYEDAGLKPVFDDVTESQMQDIFKNRPGASTLDWRHTGVKTVIGSDGQPTYEYTLSAYDPTSPMPLSKGTIDQWKADGLFKYHPEYEDIAQPGKKMTVGQFTALDKKAQELSGQQTARTMQDLQQKHIQAQIDDAKSSITEHYASARNSNLSAQEKQTELTQKKDVDSAWDNLAKVGNDPTKLQPHDRVVLAKASQSAMAESLAGIKEAASAAQNGDKDAEANLPELWKNYNSLQKLASLAPATSPVAGLKPNPDDMVNKAVAAISTMKPDDARAAVEGSTALTPEQKTATLAQWEKNWRAQQQATRQGIGAGLKTVVSSLPSLVP